MSYLVLARKWRPQTFDQVVGQAQVTQTLKNAIELNRVAHALLFTGSRGIGKTSCARILAKALNCDQGPTTSPCGACPACEQITAGRSVDVFEIDGASNNSVEQVRELRESVKFLPSNGRRKVYIIDEVHMLSTSAFNALLKTLEEPPEHVLFIFATTEPHKIPNTIHSRCQRHDFKRIPEPQIVAALAEIATSEGLSVDDAALYHVAREAQGGMRDSLSLLDQVIAYCGNEITEEEARTVLGIADRAAFAQLVKAILDGDSALALTLVDHQYRLGLDLQKFSAELLRYVRDLMVIRVCENPSHLVDLPEDHVAAMWSAVETIQPARLHRFFNLLLSGAEEISRSSFPKLSLEMLVLRMCQQGTTLPLSDVLKGLESLEKRIAQPEGAHPAEDHHVLKSLTQTDAGTSRAQSEPTPPDSTVSKDSRPTQGEPPLPTAPAQSEPTPLLSTASEDSSPTQDARPLPTASAQSTMETRPPWEPEDASSGSQTSNARSVTGSPSLSTVGDAMGVESDIQTPEGDHVDAASAHISDPPLDGPGHEDTSAAPSAESSPAAPSHEDVQGGGFKRRPGGADAYDDFSGAPPTPHTGTELRALAVKPRSAAALPKEEVRPFLAEAVEPPVPASIAAPTDQASEIVTEVEVSAPDALAQSDASSGQQPGGNVQAQAIEAPSNGTHIFRLDQTLDPMERMVSLVEWIQNEDPFLGSELSQCLRILSFETDGLVVAVPGRQWAGMADSAGALLRRTLDVSFGAEYPLNIVQCEGEDARLSGETVFDRKTRLAQEARAQRKEQAIHDPAIVRAQEFLGGRVVDVELIKDERADMRGS